MELQEAIRNRRSIRQFLAKPVPENLIREILNDSLWAPSWGNTQPWEILVVSGDKLDEFKKRNEETLLAGQGARTDIPMPQVWPEAYLNRYKDLGKGVLSALAIDRQDKEARLLHFARMFGLFDAPALILLTVDQELLLEYAMLDIGIYLQTFCLLAHDRGLGTCIMAVTVSYADLVRELFAVPENKRIVMGVILGWPDPAAPVNHFDRQRGALGEFVRWVK